MIKHDYKDIIQKLFYISSHLNAIYFGKSREDFTEEQLQMIWNIMVNADDLLYQIYDEK